MLMVLFSELRVKLDLQQVWDSKVSRLIFWLPLTSTNIHLVNDAIARNCTSISPCQQDTTIIRDAEIKANVVNECGRTELTGNIDIGENTENAIAAGQVTSVKAGTQMTVTIHQVNAEQVPGEPKVSFSGCLEIVLGHVLSFS